MSDRLLRQPCMDFVLRQTRDADHFLTGTLAPENFELGLREIKKIGEEFEAGGVGRALHRRRRQPNVQGVSAPADDRVARRPWLDAEGKGDVRPDNPLTGCG